MLKKKKSPKYVGIGIGYPLRKVFTTLLLAYNQC